MCINYKETVPLINLEELSPTFEEDKDELENVEKNSEILQHVSAGWKDDEAFMLKVCGRDGRYLKHASDRLKKDEAFIFGVFKQRDFSKK